MSAAGNNEKTTMANCLCCGLPLPANLYNDPKKRTGVFRYRSPTGRYHQIKEPCTKARALAEQANAERGESDYSTKSIRYWVDKYIKWMEQQNPILLDKRSWRDRKASLRLFAREHQKLEMRRVSIAGLSAWWDALTYDQQHSRRSNYSQFFQWAMAAGVAKENPFNHSDAVPHLIEKKKPAKRRMPIRNMGEFKAIYEHADDFLQVAMMISLTTTMRAGDVCALKFSDIIDGKLCRTIGKSAAQRGAMAATHLGWDLSAHPLLSRAINEGRKLAMQRPDRPPYIVNKRPQRRRVRAGCDDIYQVTPADLSRAFVKAVKKSGLWNDLPAGRTPPTFHEVRGLAIDLLLKSGIDIKSVQRLAAHTDESITSGYTANHPPAYVDLGIVVNDEVLI